MLAEIFLRALLGREFLQVLPGRRSRNGAQGGTLLILCVTCWILLVPTVQSSQNSHFLLPSLHEGFLPPFSTSPERPWTSLRKGTSSRGFWELNTDRLLQVVMFLQTHSLVGPASVMVLAANSAAPGHWVLQKLFPRWLNMPRHSNPVIFQMTWGFESKRSSETASATKFFLNTWEMTKGCHNSNLNFADTFL